MKKLLTMLLVLTLVLGLATVGFAAGTGTITVKNVTDDTSLELYKILSYNHESGDVDNPDGNFNTVDFANPAYKEAFVATINDASITATSSVSEIMFYITENLATSSDFAASLAAALKGIVNDEDNPIDPTYTAEDDATYANNTLTFSGVEMGYYLILDTTTAATGTEYNAVVMLQPMSPNVIVTLKSDYYTPPTKIVDETNTNVGQILTFTVEATVPSAGTENYTYTLIDRMSKGLKLVDDSIAMTYTRDGVTENFDLNGFTNEADANNETQYDANPDPLVEEMVTLVESIKYVFDQSNLKPGDEIVLTYKATVTKAAAYVNINQVQDYYNNNTGATDETEVYTYGIEVNKIDEYKNPLEGVTFILFKEIGDVKHYLQFDENGVYSDTTTVKADATELITGEYGEINVFGIQAGAYKLEEIATLENYNLLDAPVDLNITAANTVKGIFIIEVTNYSGIELPSTGGMGTVMFTIIGALVMLGAATLVVFNKKRLFNS